MTTDPQVSEFFTAGGTLPPDAPSYVKRSTDDELFRHIMAGEFCYVLTPRQMGKSSLMIRTAQRLSNQRVKSAIVDLTQIGTVLSEEQWYKGILTQVARRLRLTIDPVNWWERKKDIPNIQKFIEFFEETLSEVKEHVVIFMDEIDTTLKLDFRDNFFAGIRAIFNARAENPDLKRITFVLLGVASPSDLIKDRNRTPFNIGQEIPLRPFSRKDARMLEKGLEEVYPKFGQKILDRIFYWTNGHPYLMQKICQSVVENHLNEYDDDEIDGLVERLFISEEASRETNLQFVRDNILNYPERRVILSLYRKLLRGAAVRDNKNSLPQNHLKLSGLASVDNEILVVSNKIYSKVFDQRWVNRYTEVNWPVISSGVLGFIVIALLAVLYNDSRFLESQAETYKTRIAAYQDYRGIEALANLYQLDPIIFLTDYEDQAKRTFFTLNWERQEDLIKITYEEIQQIRPQRYDPVHYRVVVAGLYTSLADVDKSDQTTTLLEMMQSSLENLGLKDDNLYKEITHWIEARRKAKNEDLPEALDEYTQAISINNLENQNSNDPNRNAAIFFERARIYTQLGDMKLGDAQQADYKNALTDYEQAIASVRQSTGVTPAATFFPSETSLTLPPTETLTLTPAFTSTPSLTPTLTPVPTELIVGVGYINKTVASTWEEPNRGLIERLSLNHPLTILERRIDGQFIWYKCRWESNGTVHEGWILADNISFDLPPTALGVITPIFTVLPTLTSQPTAAATLHPVTPTPLETLTPTITPTPIPSLIRIQPGFLNREEIIAAVESDLSQNETLFLFYSQVSPEDYPNLATNVPILTATPTNTLDLFSTPTPTRRPTLTSTLTLTSIPVITPSPGTYTNPILVFDQNNSPPNGCLVIETNSFVSLAPVEGFERRGDGNWRFGVESGRTINVFVQTDFGQCLDVQQIGAMALNAWVLRLELQRDFSEITEPGKEIGFFIEDVNGQKREYTIWIDTEESIHLRVREGNSIILDDVVSIVNTGVLKIRGSFPRFYAEFPIQIFLEINNNGLDIIYLSQGPVQEAVEAESMDPSQMIRIDAAVRPTLGRAQKLGLIGYGGETQTLIWPLAFYEGSGQPVIVPTWTSVPVSPTPLVTPTPTQATLGIGYINKGIASVWGEPNSRLIETLNLNQSLTLLERRDVGGSTWYRCSWESDGTIFEGWILADNISFNPL